MKPNLQQAELFLSTLTGEDNPIVTFQIFYDPKDNHPPQGLAKTFTGKLQDNIAYFDYVQSQLCGVYVCLNGTDGVGRSESNIINYRTLFADVDGASEPVWPLEPSMVTQRDDNHTHAYWLIDDLQDGNTFSQLQHRIALCCNTDKQVFDPGRVVRLVGYNHLKNPKKPSQYLIKSISNKRYKVNQIEAGFTLSAKQDAKLFSWSEQTKKLEDGTGYQENERYNLDFINFCKKAPIAILGSGSYTLISTAGYAHDRGIPIDTASTILWEHYNPRCDPPWADDEQQNFNSIIKRAYKYAKNAAGCKTVVAEFTALPELPERLEPFSKQEVTDIWSNEKLNHRINRDEGSIVMAQLTAKSSHYDLALVFDALKYDGCKIIRFDNIFYEFNGHCYHSTSDALIKSEIQRQYSVFKPNNSLVKGVFNVFCDLVTIKTAQMGTYLNDNPRRTDNLIVYKNGLVDYTDTKPELEPHDINYFIQNELPYKYNPGAQCEHWIKFLNTVWKHDPDSILTLQEFMGYCLTSDTSLQKFLVIMGKSRGGKGVITNIIRQMVGVDNCSAPTLSSLTKDSILHNLSTKMVGLIPDAHSAAFNIRDSVLSNFKAITGGDPLSFEVKYKDSQTSIFKCKMVISTNNMPDFIDVSGALSNRMLVLPVIKSFAGKEDPLLPEKLSREIEGINQWALKGLMRLRINGKFTESLNALEEKQEIKNDMNPLSRFIDDMCVINEGLIETVTALYSAYNLWCNMESGVRNPMTEITFTKHLKNSDLHVHHDRKWYGEKRIRIFKGIGLRNPLLKKNIINFPK